MTPLTEDVMAVPNPFARRAPATPGATGTPPPDVTPGIEFLAAPEWPGSGLEEPPDVSVQGLDPAVSNRARLSRVRLAVAPEARRPGSVAELLALGPGEAVLRRLTFDVRALGDVVESRGGWYVLEQLLRRPTDRAANAAFREAVSASVTEGTADVLEPGDLDAEVCVGGDGDAVADRTRRELGRGRLALTPVLAASERLTQLLAEMMARPRDAASRRRFENALADLLTDLPLDALLLPHRTAPRGTVRGAWTGAGDRIVTAGWEVPGWASVPGGWAVPPAGSGPAAES